MSVLVDTLQRRTRSAHALGLLIRRWPERRAVVLGASALLFAGVFVLMRAVDDPAIGAALLSVVPVTLVALELGLGGGIAAVGVACAILTVNAAAGHPQLGVIGVATRSLAFLAVGLIAGRFSDRMREAHDREQRLLSSGLELGGVAGLERLPDVIATAAQRMPAAIGAVVELEGAPTARVGSADGPRVAADIRLRGSVLGRIELVCRSSPAPEEQAALELLALQAALAADNQRLIEREREAAAIEAQLRLVRDDLLDQRSGLGHVLETQEGQRRRMAERLHEDLAQMLAAVLLGLRMVRRETPDEHAVSLDELHRQVVAVLGDVRNVAVALRPSSLEQLGLAPALEGLADRARDERGCRVDLEISELPEPLAEPLRTEVFRIVEQAIVACPDRARMPLSVSAEDDELELDIVLPVGAGTGVVVAAIRARAELLDGSLTLEPSLANTTRLRVRLPMPSAAHRVSAPVGVA